MKIIASDYDGTMKVSEELSKEVCDAINEWQKKGNWFGIVTGRSTTTIKTEIEKYNLSPDFLICNNGGVILSKELELLKLYLIDEEVANEVIVDGERNDCTEIIINDGFRRARKSLSHENDSLHGGVATCTIDEILQQGKIAQIVLGTKDQKHAIDLAQHLNQQYAEKIEAFANLSCVDVVPKGCSKANGVLWIAEYYQLDVDKIYAIGDSYNDVSMLQAFSSATLTHAVDEIKEIADNVVSNITEFIKQID